MCILELPIGIFRGGWPINGTACYVPTLEFDGQGLLMQGFPGLGGASPSKVIAAKYDHIPWYTWNKEHE